MNNDDVKKFINISNLYTEVDLEKNKKVNEDWIGWLEDKLGMNDAKNNTEVNDLLNKMDPETKKKIDDAADKTLTGQRTSTGEDLGNGFEKIEHTIMGRTLPGIRDTQSGDIFIINNGIIRSPARYITIDKNGKESTTMDLGPETTKAFRQAKIDIPSGKDSNSTDTGNKVEPRPTGSGQIQDYGKNEWDQKYGATHNADGTPKKAGIDPLGLANPTSDDVAADQQQPKDKPRDGGNPGGTTVGAAPNQYNKDADGNLTPFTGTKVRQKFDSINDAQKADNLTAGDIITIDGIEAEVQANDQGQKFFVHPGTLTPYDQPKPQDGSIDAVGSEEDPEVTDQEGGVAQGMGQADAGAGSATQDPTGNVGGADAAKKAADDATQEPVNTKDLMTRYNEGGKKAMPEIKKLQTELSRLGFDPNGIDGKYGNGTFKAVQEFQKANGLQVDGQAGTNTLAALEKAVKGDQPDAEKALPADQDQSPQDGAEVDPAQTSNDAQAAQDKADADAKDDPMTAANQQKDIDTAQPNADLARYIELLNKLEGGQQNAGTPDATQGRVVASYDFRNLITLVESKLLNEKLTPAEEKELAALHAKVQGYVGTPGMDDDKITAQLNRYLKLVKEPTKTAANNIGPDGKYDGDDLGNAPTAKKVSKELYVQMAPNRNASLANFNVSQMKAKYPKPYLEIPNKDGTVTRGYGPLKNLEDFVANNGKKFKAKIIGKPAQQVGKPNAELDGAQRGVQTASKDNNMKKAIKEASMNISINGDSAAEVAELAGILKNAGMHDAKPVSDILPRPGEKPAMAMDPHDDMVSKMSIMDEPAPDDSPCGMGEEGVEEDSWDNSPDETYADTQTMTKDLSGGLNREKKSYPATQDGDNPMAVENSIKEQLWAALNEKMTTEGSRGKKSRGKKKSRG